ncbi:hypothetical protein J421_4321 [Gemmatirosa kalamazoonensis]|uniref:Uncharacterized protein n=1 Tax=Gemmatirosa kalamazoonensis TaxID=861299 RepID=W0RQN2_9BACT|nr:hypothetical protein [Gemmatirosa kalamazoonensis]AHG91858.1 hypothetical protein J421_4321 [Gemmatirosa kalamazoonensis]
MTDAREQRTRRNAPQLPDCIHGRPRQPGRPIEITPEIVTAVAERIASGNWFETAARLAGVPPRTASRWLGRGLAAFKQLGRARRGDAPPADEAATLCLAFWLAVRTAEAKREDAHVQNITRCAMGSPRRTITTERTLLDGTRECTVVVEEERAPIWTASAWMLERTSFRRWGRKEAREFSGPGGSGIPLAMVREILTEDATDSAASRSAAT